MVVTTKFIVAVAAFLASSYAAGAPYSQLIIFGDSLSDVGNVGSIPLSPYPGDGYWQNRFSNGPVYAEHLAEGLGLPPLIRSRAGGTNYAYGGAQTSGTGGLSGWLLSDVDEQVNAYLDSQTADPAALYVVFAGANDFFNGQSDPQVPLNELGKQVIRLADAGVEQLLVANLPLLGETPAYRNSATERQKFNDLASTFNAGLSSLLESIETTYDEVDIFRLDVAYFFADAIANPTRYGLSNVTDQAAMGLAPGRLYYNDENIVDNPETYLFWDHVHPTATGHRLLGEFARDLVALPGDFNNDGEVDAADYTIWRNSLGTSVAAGTGADANGDSLVGHRDYLLWRAHYGQRSVELAFDLQSVPEPNAYTLLLLALPLVAGQRRFANLGRKSTKVTRGDTAH